jgi:predicted negative regulator of RcsB-dependent stress response
MSILIIVILLGLSGYLGWRVWFLAGQLAEAQEYVETLEATNQFMYSRIERSYNAMQQIDRLGAFESEDEAGTTFELLKEVVTELKEEFENGESEKK